MITLELISSLSLADPTAGSAHVGRLTRDVSIAGEFVGAAQRAGASWTARSSAFPHRLAQAGVLTRYGGPGAKPMAGPSKHPETRSVATIVI